MHIDDGDTVEYARLAALQRYRILDTLPEPDFDRITRLAAHICDAPLGMINLIDRDRQWSKAASDGSPPPPIPRATSFCASTIQHTNIHIVPDMLADERFVNNPFVQADNGIRFYAGAPIRTKDGYNIGSLCVIDTITRSLTATQATALVDLAAIVMDALDLRLQLTEKVVMEANLTQALRRAEESETKYKTLFQVLPIGVSITDSAGQIVEVNPASEVLLGMTTADQRQRSLYDPTWQILHIDGSPMPIEEFAAVRALREGRCIDTVPLGIIKPDGQTTWVTVTALPIPLSGYGVLAVYHDITATRQAEHALRESEGRFATAFRMSPIALMIRKQADGRILDVNDQFCHLFEHTREGLIGRTGDELQIWEDPREPERIFHAMQRDGQVRDWETTLRIGGHGRKVILSIEPLRLAGEPCLLTALYDITERWRVEQQLTALARQSAMLAELSYTINEVRVSDSHFVQHIAQRAAEVLGDACVIHLLADDQHALVPAAWSHPDPAAGVFLEALVHATARTPGAGIAGQVAITGEGVLIPVLPPRWLEIMVPSDLWPAVEYFGFHSAIAVPLRLHSRSIGVLVINRDKHQPAYSTDDRVLVQEVADRIALAINNAQLFGQAQEALRRANEARALLDTLFATAPIGLAYQDRNLRFMLVNEQLARINGVSAESHIGRTMQEMMPDLAPTLAILQQQVFDTGVPVTDVELSGPTAAAPDEFRHWLANYYPVRTLGGEIVGVGLVVVDITERKRTEEAIQQYAARLGSLSRIDEAILALQSPAAIAQTAVRCVRQLLRCSRASVASIDPDTLDAMIVAVDVDGTTNLKAGTRMPKGTYSLPPELRAGKVYLHDDIRIMEHPSQGFRALQADGIRSYAVVPLMVQEEIIGSLNVGADKPYAFHTYHIKMLCEVASHLTIAFQNAQLFEQVRAGRERLRTLSSRLVDIQEAERRYLARELHDEIGQVLTGVKLYLHRLQHISTMSQLQESMGETVEVVEHALQQVRNLSLDLRPSMLDDFGLVSALRWYGQRQAQLGGFTFEVQANAEDARYSTEIETTCFRIAQEALTNIVRHARAAAVTVEVRDMHSELMVCICDDGHGFDVVGAQERAMQAESLGLLGMRERAYLVGGRFDIQSSPAGTVLSVRVPIVSDTIVEKRQHRRTQV